MYIREQSACRRPIHILSESVNLNLFLKIAILALASPASCLSPHRAPSYIYQLARRHKRAELWLPRCGASCSWSPSSGVPRRSLARARTGTPTHAPATGPVAETQRPALLLVALCPAERSVPDALALALYPFPACLSSPHASHASPLLEHRPFFPVCRALHWILLACALATAALPACAPLCCHRRTPVAPLSMQQYPLTPESQRLTESRFPPPTGVASTRAGRLPTAAAAQRPTRSARPTVPARRFLTANAPGPQ